MLTTHKIRVGPGARQMSSQGVKQSQANEGADSAKQGTMCSVQEDRTASPGRCRSLWEILKVSDDKVTHHFHQKGAFGLNGELHFTPKRHPEDSQTVIGLTNCCVRSVRSVRLETGHGNTWCCPECVRSCPECVRSCPERVR